MEQDLEAQISLLREEIHNQKKATMADSPGHSWKNGVARMGIEFVSAIFAGIIMGLLLDSFFAIKPWGIVSCFLLGCIAGFYNIYKLALGELTLTVDEEDKINQ